MKGVKGKRPSPAPLPSLLPDPSWLTSLATSFLICDRKALAQSSGLPLGVIKRLLDGEWWPGPVQIQKLALGSGLSVGQVVEALLPVNLSRMATWGIRRQQRHDDYTQRMESWRKRKQADGSWEERGLSWVPAEAGLPPPMPQKTIARRKDQLRKKEELAREREKKKAARATG